MKSEVVLFIFGIDTGYQKISFELLQQTNRNYSAILLQNLKKKASQQQDFAMLPNFAWRVNTLWLRNFYARAVTPIIASNADHIFIHLDRV